MAARPVHYRVPFVRNYGNRCLPANIGSILRYFLPSSDWHRPVVDQLCGYLPSKGAWSIQSVLSLAGLGLRTMWVEDSSLNLLAKDPDEFMRQRFPDATQRRFQLEHSDLSEESRRAREFLAASLPFHQRPGTLGDIQDLLDDGWLVRLTINGAALYSQAGSSYNPHSVLAIGYGSQGVIVHNADGIYGNVPSQFVAWNRLSYAWAQYDGSRQHPSMILNAFKL